MYGDIPGALLIAISRKPVMIVQPANSLLVLAVLIVPPSQAAKQCQLDMSTKNAQS